MTRHRKSFFFLKDICSDWARKLKIIYWRFDVLWKYLSHATTRKNPLQSYYAMEKPKALRFASGQGISDWTKIEVKRKERKSLVSMQITILRIRCAIISRAYPWSRGISRPALPRNIDPCFMLQSWMKTEMIYQWTKGWYNGSMTSRHRD